MPTFRLTADMLFDAADATSAATQLSEYFTFVARQFEGENGKPNIDLHPPSNVTLAPYEEEAGESIAWGDAMERLLRHVEELSSKGEEHGIVEIHSGSLTVSPNETKFIAQCGEKVISSRIYSKGTSPWWEFRIHKKTTE